MKEEKTQGIDTETTTKDRLNTTETASKTELLDLRAGYDQHTSPKNVVNNISAVVNDIRYPALKYWQDEIATKGEQQKKSTPETLPETLICKSSKNTNH
jgi:hypothetical protein